MQVMLQQQETLLQQIAGKLQVNGPVFQCQDQELLSPGVQSDAGSMYDNLSAMTAPSSAPGGSHKRSKSIRDVSTERPKSIRM